MPKDDNQVIVRLPRELIDRLDDLARRLNDDPQARLVAGPHGVTRSAALRLALQEGLVVLEKRGAKRR